MDRDDLGNDLLRYHRMKKRQKLPDYAASVNEDGYERRMRKKPQLKDEHRHSRYCYRHRQPIHSIQLHRKRTC